MPTGVATTGHAIAIASTMTMANDSARAGVNEQIRGGEEVDHIPAWPEAVDPVAHAQASAQCTKRPGVASPDKHERRLRSRRSDSRERPDEGLLILDPVRTPDRGEHGPAVEPEFPANRTCLCSLARVEPVELEAVVHHGHLLRRDPVDPHQRVAHLGDGAMIASQSGPAHRRSTAVSQRRSCTGISCEWWAVKMTGSPSEPGSRQAYETAVQQVRLDHVDLLCTEAPRESEDRPGIAGAAIGSRVRMPGVPFARRLPGARRNGMLTVPSRTSKRNAVGVIADQLEVGMRAGAADEVENAHSASGENACPIPHGEG